MITRTAYAVDAKRPAWSAAPVPAHRQVVGPPA